MEKRKRGRKKEKRKESHEKIITALGKQNDQTWTGLQKSTELSSKPLRDGINELITENIIKKNGKHYHLQSETKNKILSSKELSKLLSIDIDESMKELRESETPFELGYTILRFALYYHTKLILEQHSPILTKVEKIGYERLIEHCNEVIKKTFEVLEEIDIKQTLAIKKALDLVTYIPKFEYNIWKGSSRQQKRRAERIAKKII